MPEDKDDKKKITDRISRIQGQVKAIKKMVENDRDSFDVLKQIAAINGAVRSLGLILLEDHLRGCVSKSLVDETHREETIDEIVKIFHKFSR